ncbi:MAG: hypothetical protein RMK29_16680 [Myxococcales bacterium]|nr:hypothetical protein [Myxococcota bacterium]MDW8283344.1 hypothetical protein [Myxococcales bacterium]
METVTHQDALRELELLLRRQAWAAQEDDQESIVALADESLRRLACLEEAVAGGYVSAAELRHLRDLAGYSQLLLRQAFTRWAATRLAEQRGTPRYNAQGRMSVIPCNPETTARGVL